MNEDYHPNVCEDEFFGPREPKKKRATPTVDGKRSQGQGAAKPPAKNLEGNHE